jgi:hypothetical protein
MTLRTAYRPTRCVEGRTMRHDPQHDDPELETDIGQCEECDGKGCVTCEECGAIGSDGDSLCDDCEQNRAEAAWERHCEDFHDGGCTRFNSLRDDQAAARRLK